MMRLRGWRRWVWWGRGSRCDPKKFPGMAHLVEHLLFRSTLNEDKETVMKVISERGGVTNGATEIDGAQFSIYMHHWDVGYVVEGLAKILCDLSISEEQLELEKSIIKEEMHIIGESSPTDLRNLIFHEMFENPELQHTPGGTYKLLKKVGIEDVRAFYEQWYRSENIVIAFVGRFNREKVLNQIEPLFCGLSLGKALPPQAVRVRKGRRYKIIRPPSSSALVVLNYPCFDLQSKQNCCLEILKGYFCEGPQSRLFEILREQKGFAYLVDGGMYLSYDFGLMSAICLTNYKHIREVVNIILQESETLAIEGLSEEEFEKARQRCIRNILLMKDDPLSCGMWYAERELQSGRDNAGTVAEYVRELESASWERVNRVAAGVFSLSRSFCLIQGGMSLWKMARIKRALKTYARRAEKAEGK
ncbi:MAG: insulinase family protein [Planctomycetes bacterium]|nr:insulinase family protein [Planctomycetota bacterium]